jgi:predicted transcriptional regulator of viral defense system
MSKQGYMNLSKDEIYLISRVEYEKQKLITTAYARGLYNDSNKASKIIASLLRKKRLIRIEKGKYLLVPIKAPNQQWVPNEFVVAALWMGNNPYYIGYFTMYNYWGFTDQIPQTIYVLNTKKFSRTVIGGVRYEAIKIDQKKYYGIKKIMIEGEEVSISDKERTLVDMIYKPIGSFESLLLVIKNNLKKIDLLLFIDYLKQFPVVSIRRRAGYLLEKVGCSPVSLRELRKSIGLGKTFVALDPAGPRSGKINKEWGIIVNR